MWETVTVGLSIVEVAAVTAHEGAPHDPLVKAVFVNITAAPTSPAMSGDKYSNLISLKNCPIVWPLTVPFQRVEFWAQGVTSKRNAPLHSFRSQQSFCIRCALALHLSPFDTEPGCACAWAQGPISHSSFVLRREYQSLTAVLQPWQRHASFTITVL